MNRRCFLPWLLTLPLTILHGMNIWRDGEREKNGRMYFYHRNKTFVVWPDGDGPLTDTEKKRARQMAKDYFNENA